jgi:hypothetical protein
MSSDPKTLGAIATALSLGLLWCGLRAGRKQRLLDDTPVSKALGVFIGEVEIEGACVLSEPFTAHLSGQRCAIYRWSVEEQWERWETETYTDKDGRTRTRRVLRSGWTTVAEGGESSGFYIQDETGYVWVRPKGAEIELLTMFSASADRGDDLYHEKGPAEEIGDSTGRRRFFETGMPVGTRLFVRGRARERTDIVAAEIAEDPRAEMFIISPRKESDLSAGREGAYWTWCVLGFLLAIIAACGFAATEIGFRGAAPWWGGIAYVLAWFGGWVWMVYNSLVGLRLRVQQAWSLIDVQLKRRADLIPALAACLQGYRDHEAKVQAAIAELRAQAAAGGRVNALTPTLVALQEAYPDLRAQESFRELHANLVETEQRIALARNYYNDSATFHNTRLERVPDRYVANLLKMQPAALFAATGFERAAVGVKF